MSIWNDGVDLSGTHASWAWQEHCKYLVLDPDGWDRLNFQYSWFEEQIMAQEFEQRLMSSTIQQVQR